MLDADEWVPDVVVIGGGPAGLHAALTLGRVHVPTLVVDSGSYRNERSHRMHDVLGQDGIDPSEFRRQARRELEPYDVRIRDAVVERIDRRDDGFAVVVDGESIEVPRVILATGVRDELLPVPGLADLWGELALPCPYCHAHEFAGRRIALLGDGEWADHVGGLLERVASEVVRVPPADAVRVERSGDGIRIQDRGAGPVEAACVFVSSGPRAATPFAEQLGLRVSGAGIVVDERFRTSVASVWAVGDAAARPHPFVPSAVTVAMAQGLIAGADCASSLSGHERRRD